MSIVRERERERERVIRVCSTTLEELGKNLGGSFFIFKYELNNIYWIFLFKIYFSYFLRCKITNQVLYLRFSNISFLIDNMVNLLNLSCDIVNLL